MADGNHQVLTGDVIMPGDPLCPVMVQPSPFRADRVDMTVAEGANLEEIAVAAGYPVTLHHQLNVYIGDELVPQAVWRLVRPKRGAQVFIGVRLGGRGTLRSVALFAVVVIALYFAPYLVGGLPGGAGAVGAGTATLAGSTVAFNVATAVATAAIATAGAALVNALIPLPTAQNHYGFDQQLGNPYAQLTGLSNRMVPYGPIPRVFGKRRMYPMLAARPYTETVGNDQYLRMLLMVGYGPLKIDPANLKIGETPIGSIAEAQYEVLEGWGTDGAPTLFQKNIQEDAYQILLGDASDQVIKTTHANTTEVSIDLTALGGIVKMSSKGEMQDWTVDFLVQWRPTGGGAWNDAVWISGGSSYGTGTNGQLKITDKSQSAVRRSGRFLVGGGTPGQYDIQISRMTAKDTSGRVADQVYLTTLRSIVAGDPAPMKGVCYIGLRLKATGQLNGAPDTINCVAESYLPVYSGGTWTYQITRNPAWAYADLMRRRGLNTVLADSRLDISEIAAWAAECDAAPPTGTGPYWTFDAVFEGGSIFNALRQVAAHGRAAFNIRDGKYSVVRDKPQTVPVQHISPRNSSGYSGSKAFVDVPHAFRVRFNNEAIGYAEDEVIVYRAGYSKAGGSGTTAASKFETIELTACTRADQAWREGMYHMAVVLLRPEQHQVVLDIENLRCSMGDLVRFSHDAIKVGLGHGRVVSRVVSGSNTTGFNLDGPVTMATGKSYALRLRKSDGASVICPITTVAGDQSTVTLTTPIASSSAPDTGDLFMFGEAGLESAPMMVRQIEPGPDLTARVTLVDAQPGVWTADSGTIPAFQSYITTPVPIDRVTPPKVDFTLDSGTLSFSLQSDGSVRGRISVNFLAIAPGVLPVDAIEVQYRNYLSQVWQSLPRYPRETTSVWIDAVYSGDNYEVRARTVSANGTASEWTSHVVQANGKVVPPAEPSALVAVGNFGSIGLKWVNPIDADLAKIEVWSAASNDRSLATKVAEVAAPGNSYIHSGLTTGDDWFYWVRAVDSSGNLSPNYYPASATAGIGGVVTGISSGDLDNTPPPNVSAAPTLTLNTGTDASGGVYSYLRVDWSDVTDAGLYAYVVEVSLGGSSVDFLAKTNSYELRGLTKGTYTVKIKAVDRAGNVSAAWSPSASVTVGVIAEGSNLVPDGGLTLNGQGWTISGWAVGSGSDVGGKFLTTSTPGAQTTYSATFPVVAGQDYTLSAMAGAGLNGGEPGTFALYLEYLNSSNGVVGTSAAANFPRNVGYDQIKASLTAPGTAVKARVKAASSGAVFSGGVGFSLAFHIKVEHGLFATAWNDDASTGALYADGTSIDSLKPLDANATANTIYRSQTTPSAHATGDFWVVLDGVGNAVALRQWNGSQWVLTSDVTSTGVAAGIAGQGSLATRSATVIRSSSTPSSFTGGGPLLVGDIWVKLDGNGRETGAAMWLGSGWNDFSTQNRITRSTTAPSSPVATDIWVLTDGSGTALALRVWTGSAWVTTADLTSSNTAAAIAGQSVWATTTGLLGLTPTTVQGRTQYFATDGKLYDYRGVLFGYSVDGVAGRFTQPLTTGIGYISCAAHSVYLPTASGATAVSVSSATISGLSDDTDYTWFYRPQYGDHFCPSSNNAPAYLASIDGYMLVGNARTPTSANTYVPPGSTTPVAASQFDGIYEDYFCVAAAATLASGQQAGNAAKGDPLTLLTPNGQSQREGSVLTAIQGHSAPCWTLTTAKGAVLTVSETAPIVTRLSPRHMPIVIRVADCEPGTPLPILLDGALVWDVLEGVEFVGERVVAKITADSGHGVYAASDRPQGPFLFTHNMYNKA